MGDRHRERGGKKGRQTEREGREKAGDRQTEGREKAGDRLREGREKEGDGQAERGGENKRHIDRQRHRDFQCMKIHMQRQEANIYETTRQQVIFK